MLRNKCWTTLEEIEEEIIENYDVSRIFADLSRVIQFADISLFITRDCGVLCEIGL